MKQNIVYLILTFLLISCREKSPEINFYYWKSNVNIGDNEKKYFNELNSKTLYIRVFDIDNAGNGASPKAKLVPFDSQALSANYVPVVFITNRTFSNLSEDAIKSLADNTNKLINESFTANKINNFNEIQIDCDWTGSTREAYFAFLSKLKEISGKRISSTIRLHQIKYKNKTGVPPIDKGYLMCYATENPSEPTDKNTILDLDILKDYLQNVNDYPIPFDIALPLYSWAIVTNHLGRIKLINAVTRDELNTTDFEQKSENMFRVQEDVFFHGMYLNKDFTLKLEEISPDLLKSTKNHLKKHVKKEYSIVYYHLDSQFLTQYSIEDLE